MRILNQQSVPPTLVVLCSGMRQGERWAPLQDSQERRRATRGEQQLASAVMQIPPPQTPNSLDAPCFTAPAPWPSPLTQVRAQRQRAGRLRRALPHHVQVLSGVEDQLLLPLQEGRHIVLGLRPRRAAGLHQRVAALGVERGPQRPPLVPECRLVVSCQRLPPNVLQSMGRDP